LKRDVHGVVLYTLQDGICAKQIISLSGPFFLECLCDVLKCIVGLVLFEIEKYDSNDLLLNYF
jgi:hypothetical protein